MAFKIRLVLVVYSLAVLWGCGREAGGGSGPYAALVASAGDAEALYALLDGSQGEPSTRSSFVWLAGGEGCPKPTDNPALYSNCRLEFVVDGARTGEHVVINGVVISSPGSVELVDVREELPVRFLTEREAARLNIEFEGGDLEGVVVLTAAGRLAAENGGLVGNIRGDIVYERLVVRFDDGESFDLSGLDFDYSLDYEGVVFDADGCPTDGVIVTHSDALFPECVKSSRVEFRGCGSTTDTLSEAEFPEGSDPDEWRCCLQIWGLEAATEEEVLGCLF